MHCADQLTYLLRRNLCAIRSLAPSATVQVNRHSAHKFELRYSSARPVGAVVFASLSIAGNLTSLAGRLVRKGDFGGWWVRFEGERQDRFCSTGGLSGACYELCKVRPGVSASADTEGRGNGHFHEKDASAASTTSQNSHEGLLNGRHNEQGQHQGVHHTPSISANVSSVTVEATGSMCHSPSICDGSLSNCVSAQKSSPSGQNDSSYAQAKPARPPRSSVSSNQKAVSKDGGQDLTKSNNSQHSNTTPRVLPSRCAGMSVQQYEASISDLLRDNADLKRDNSELREENIKCKQALTDMASRRVFADSEAAEARGQEQALARQTEMGLRLRLEEAERDAVRLQTQMRLDQEELGHKLHTQQQELRSAKSALLEGKSECERLRSAVVRLEADKESKAAACAEEARDHIVQRHQALDMVEMSGCSTAVQEECDSLRVELASALEELANVKDARLEAERKGCAKDLELTRLGEELRTRKFTLQRLEASAEEKLSYIRRLEKETASLKKDVEARNDKIQNLSVECDRIQGECHRFHSQNLDGQKELEKLQEEIEALSSHKTAAEAERHRAAEEIHRLNTQLRDLQQAQDKLRKQVFEEHKAARDARAQCTDLGEALGAARERELSLQHDVESLYRQLQDLRVAMEYLPPTAQFLQANSPAASSLSNGGACPLVQSAAQASALSSKIETLSTTSDLHYNRTGEAVVALPQDTPVFKPSSLQAPEATNKALPLQDQTRDQGDMRRDASIAQVHMHENAGAQWSHMPGLHGPMTGLMMGKTLSNPSSAFHNANANASTPDLVGGAVGGNQMIPSRMQALQQAYVMKKVQEHKDQLWVRQQQQQHHHQEYFKSLLQMSKYQHMHQHQHQQQHHHQHHEQLMLHQVPLVQIARTELKTTTLLVLTRVP